MRHPNDTYTHTDGRRIRAMKDAILVKPDPPPTHSASGLIEYAPSAMEHVMNTGTIVAFGFTRVGKKQFELPIPDIEVGEKVVFVRFLAEQESNKQVRKMFDTDDGTGIIRIQPKDVLLVYTADEHDRINR